MATIDILGLTVTPSVTGTDAYIPLSSVLADATYRATVRTILAASVPSTSSISPTTDYTVTVVKTSDGLAYSISISEFMTALHGVPAGGTTNEILGKLSNADYDIGWITAGTVSSIALTMPAIFSVSGSPVTSSGTIAVTLATETANTVWAGPTTGSAATPTFRTLVAADLPTVTVAKGGTSLTSLTIYNLLIGNDTSAPTLLAPHATTGIPLVSQGSSANPAYSTAVVAGGGTGLTSATAYAVLCGGTTSTGAFQSIASVGTSGQVLTSNGAGNLPTFQTASSAFGAALTRVSDTNVTLTLGGTPTTALLAATSITVGWSGQLALTRGGTNASLVASNGGIVYSDASAFAILAGTATAGQIIRSGSSAAPSWSTSVYPATSAAGTILASLTANTITASAAPVLGASGTATGQLGLSGTTSGTVTIKPQDAAGTYNFNLPTSAGTAGQPLLSGGGGASAQTYGTLSVAGGGTGAATLTAFAVLLGNGTSAVDFATIGTAGRLLIDQGAGANPAFTAMSGDATIAGSGALTIANNAVTYAKFQQAAGLSILAVTGSSTANYGAITGTANQLPFVNSGASSLAFGSLSTLLDNVLSSTQGAVIYRGAATWAALGPGSSGQFLQTQGAALNPQWAAAAGGGSVTSVTASSQGLTINGVGGAAGGSFNVSGTITPIQTINAQTGTTYTVLSTDHTKLVTFSNTSAVAVTLPQANGAGFNAGFWWAAQNINSGTVTITPTTSTIDGATTLTLLTGQGVRITSDGTNYYTQRGVQALGMNMALNLGISASAAAGALTITVTDALGATPTGGNPILIPFRSATATTGSLVLRAITASTTLTLPSGAELGVTSGTPVRVWLVLFDDAGTVRLGAINCTTASATAMTIYGLSEFGVASSTTVGTGSDSAQTFYTGTGVTSKAYRTIGFVEYTTLTTTGTWTAPDRLQVWSPAIPLPGRPTGNSAANIATTEQTTTSNAFPSGTSVASGIGIVQSITPTSTCNLVRVKCIGVVLNGNIALANAVLALHRTDTLIGTAQQGPSAGAATGSLSFVTTLEWTDNPATTSATVYSMKFRSGDGVTTMTFPRTTGVASTGTTLSVQEIMG